MDAAMRSYGRGFVTAIDPYRDNGPDDEGDVCCLECGGVFGDLAALRAAGLQAYPRLCGTCRAEARAERDAPFEDAPTTWGGLERWSHAPGGNR